MGSSIATNPPHEPVMPVSHPLIKHTPLLPVNLRDDWRGSTTPSLVTDTLNTMYVKPYPH